MDKERMAIAKERWEVYNESAQKIGKSLGVAARTVKDWAKDEGWCRSSGDVDAARSDLLMAALKEGLTPLYVAKKLKALMEMKKEFVVPSNKKDVDGNPMPDEVQEIPDVQAVVKGVQEWCKIFGAYAPEDQEIEDDKDTAGAAQRAWEERRKNETKNETK